MSYAAAQLLGKHLGNASGKFDETAKKAEKFKDRLADFTGVRGELPAAGDKLPGLDE